MEQQPNPPSRFHHIDALIEAGVYNQELRKSILETLDTTDTVPIDEQYNFLCGLAERANYLRGLAPDEEGGLTYNAIGVATRIYDRIFEVPEVQNSRTHMLETSIRQFKALCNDMRFMPRPSRVSAKANTLRDATERKQRHYAAQVLALLQAAGKMDRHLEVSIATVLNRRSARSIVTVPISNDYL